MQGLTLFRGEGLDGINILGHEKEAAADNDCNNTLNQEQPAGQTQGSACMHQCTSMLHCPGMQLRLGAVSSALKRAGSNNLPLPAAQASVSVQHHEQCGNGCAQGL